MNQNICVKWKMYIYLIWLVSRLLNSEICRLWRQQQSQDLSQRGGGCAQSFMSPLSIFRWGGLQIDASFCRPKFVRPLVCFKDVGTYSWYYTHRYLSMFFFVDLVLSDHYSGVKELGTYSWNYIHRYLIIDFIDIFIFLFYVINYYFYVIQYNVFQCFM